MSALVLGVGNILLSDEGVGVRVVEEMLRRYSIPDTVEVLDGGTAGMDLLDALAGRRHVIIVDAVRTGDAPGTVVRLHGDDVPRLFKGRISPHQLGISDLLAVLTLTGEQPDHLVVVGAVPADLELGVDLSPTMAARLGDLVDMVASELRAWGFALEPTQP